MTNGRRDYKRERAWEKANGDKRGKDRSTRNKARRKLGLKVGDPRQAGHKKALSKGGSGLSLANLFPQSKKSNESFARNKDGSMKSETSKRERKKKK